MKLDVELTDRQVMFLKQYANVYQDERDIDYTADPLVAVRTRRLRRCTVDDNVDVTSYVIDNDFEESLSSLGEVRQILTDEECIYIDKIKEKIINYCKKYNQSFTEEELEEKVKDYIEDVIYDLEYSGEYSDEILDVEAVYFEYDYVPVAYFLTRAEAEKYIQYQGHNLTEPTVYTYYTGYNNMGDLTELKALLLEIGKTLLSRESTDEY